MKKNTCQNFMKAVDGPIPEFWLELMKYLMNRETFSDIFGKFFIQILQFLKGYTSKTWVNTRPCYNKRVLVSISKHKCRMLLVNKV